MNTSKLILLPGLAADERLFHHQVRELPNVTVPKWLEPTNQENLSEYAQRMSQSIDFSSGDFLGGMSFGGQVALELAKHLPAKGVFLISANRRSSEITPRFKYQQKLLQSTPDPMIKLGLKNIGLPFISHNENLDDQALDLLRGMIEDLDLPFLRWSAQAAAEWEFDFNPKDFKMPIFQIHGEFDNVIQLSQPHEVDILKGAHHLINYTHHKELNTWLKEKMLSSS